MNLYKKLLSCIIAVAVVLLIGIAVLPTEAQAATEGYYTYTISNEQATITDCDTSISRAVTIPSTLGGYPVTSIGAAAFQNCTRLTSIIIPDSVTTIGGSAFTDCTNLTNITIPDSVTSIKSGTFSNCTWLTSITIPDSVTSISNLAFEGCCRLKGIWVGENNINYSNDENGVLFNKDKTTIVTCPRGLSGQYTIPDSVTNIGDYAFIDCTNLTSSIIIPDSVTNIGDYAFMDCANLTSITIPNSVTSIGDYTFFGCTNLTSITIPDSVTSIIGSYMFCACTRLSSITIPSSITGINFSAFRGCTSLSTVYYTGTRAEWNAIWIGNDNEPLLNANLIFLCKHTYENACDADCNKCGEVRTDIHTFRTVGTAQYCTTCGHTTNAHASGTCGDKLTWVLDYDGTLTIFGTGAMWNYDGSSNVPWCGDRSSVKTAVIECGVTNIGAYTFSGCDGLTGVTIGNGITDIGKFAFYGCKSLTNITIPEGVTSIGNLAFHRCEGLTSITIPDSVTTIGYAAFIYCTGLTSITIPDGVASIGESAFYDCNKLTRITIPDSVTSIELRAFTFCTRLTTVYYAGTRAEWNAIAISKENEPLLNANLICLGGCDHTYDNNCDATCNTCGENRTITHDYKTAWSKDMSHHWHECSVCKDKKDQAAHTPGAAATETTAQTCTTCGYVIKSALGHSHNFANAWNKDENGHWHDCTGCAEKGDYAAHTPGAAATETTPQTCTVCGYEIAPALGKQETQPTDATEPTDPAEPTVPAGGGDDGDEIPVWIFLACAFGGGGVIGGAVGAVVFVCLKKKR